MKTDAHQTFFAKEHLLQFADDDKAQAPGGDQGGDGSMDHGGGGVTLQSRFKEGEAGVTKGGNAVKDAVIECLAKGEALLQEGHGEDGRPSQFDQKGIFDDFGDHGENVFQVGKTDNVLHHYFVFDPHGAPYHNSHGGVEGHNGEPPDLNEDQDNQLTKKAQFYRQGAGDQSCDTCCRCRHKKGVDGG